MNLANFLLLMLLLGVCTGVADAASYKYKRVGNREDLQTRADAGIAMMGGGSDLDEAFRWLCDKANGGDFLILRAHGGNDYNPYVKKLCKVNSVATLVIPSREAAQEPRVAEIIASGGGGVHCRRRPVALREFLEGNSGGRCDQCAHRRRHADRRNERRTGCAGPIRLRLPE